MKKINLVFDASREHSEIAEWLARPGNREFMLEKRMAGVVELLGGPLTVESVGRMASGLDTLAVWWRNEFLDMVFRDSRDITSGCMMIDYAFYDVRISTAISDTPGCYRWFSDNPLYLLYLFLLAFRRHEQASWLGGRIWGGKEENARRPEHDKDGGFPPWMDAPLGGFVLRLYLVFSGRWQPGNDLPDDLPAAGAYEGVFTHWHNPDGLAHAICDACDYHVSRMREDPSVPYDVAEFGHLPYSVLPVEILALRNVREWIGLATPWPDHPLLTSPFVTNLPAEIPACDDKLLLDVIAAADKVLPGFLTDNPLHVIPGVVPLPEKDPLPPPPEGLQRDVETSGMFWSRKDEIVIRYHIPSSEAAARCGGELFAQMVREFRNRKRVHEVEIHVTGAPDDMMLAYQAFQQASAANPAVEKWLLEEVPRFEFGFETPEGELVRDFEYWTEDGQRMSAEIKPSGE